MLIACSKDCEQVQRQLAVAEDTECRQLLSNAGVSIVTSDAIDLAAFRATAAKAQF
jgi:hypothetical protein